MQPLTLTTVRFAVAHIEERVTKRIVRLFPFYLSCHWFLMQGTTKEPLYIYMSWSLYFGLLNSLLSSKVLVSFFICLFTFS
eukprot:gene5974-4283_t